MKPNILTQVQSALDRVNQDINDGDYDNYCGDAIIEAQQRLEWFIWLLTHEDSK